MSTHVIILAQGSQSRLPALPVAKQMLPLPSCADTPILLRTLRQLWHVMDLADKLSVRESGVDPGKEPFDITVVAHFPLVEQLLRTPVSVPWLRRDQGTVSYLFTPNVETLADPGNSSLKGIHRYLARYHLVERGQEKTPQPDRYVVLLGDVVYSWACLRALFAPFDTTRDQDAAVTFVGTSNISPSGGELWGLSWGSSFDPIMIAALGYALKKHPPFTEYQPGQMRRWMWALHPSFQTTPKYTAIDDYTMDVDLPEHIEWLEGRSVIAAHDDAENGVVW